MLIRYAVYAQATRELVSIGAGEPPASIDAAYGLVTFEPPVDFERKVWDPVTLMAINRPAVQRAVLTPDEFWDRLTGAELVAIEAASRANTQNGYQVAVAVKVLDRAAVLDITLPRIRAALQVFVTRGLLTSQRLDEITTPVLEP